MTFQAHSTKITTLLLALGGVLAACGSSTSAVVDAAPTGDGSDTRTHFAGFACSGAAPSFERDVHPLVMNCGSERCHGGLASGSFPYAALVNVATKDTCSLAGQVVTPRDLGRSYILHKLTGTQMCGDGKRMPLMVDPLPRANIQIIVDWICQGAPDN